MRVCECENIKSSKNETIFNFFFVVTDPNTLIFDPEEDEDEFFFHGNKQTHRDITKRVHKKLLMDFDDVFNDQSSNGDIFETCMKPLVTEVMNGFSCSGKS